VQVRRQRSGQDTHQARVHAKVHQKRVQVGGPERVDEALLLVEVLLGERLDDATQRRHLIGREHARNVHVAVAVELLEDLAGLLGVEALRCRRHWAKPNSRPGE